MFKDAKAFSGFSVNDLDKAKVFYGETLGLNIEMTSQGLKISLANGGIIFIYAKANHTPASFTILNFPVDNINKAVEALKTKGITFEHYDTITDEKGIARGITNHMGPDIAWFKDPAGNILSLLHEES